MVDQEDFRGEAKVYYQYNPLKNVVEFTVYVAGYYKDKMIFKGRCDMYEPESGELGDEILVGPMYYNQTSITPLEDGSKFLDELERLTNGRIQD